MKEGEGEVSARLVWRSARRYALGAGGIGFVGGGLLLAGAISRSTSSTAAIGYLFVPFSALVFFAIPACLAGLCLGYLRAKQRAGSLALSPFALISGGVLVLVTGWAAVSLATGLYLSGEVHGIAHMGPSGLEGVLASPLLGESKFILGAVAQNPNATPQMLHRIASVQDPELHLAMGSLFDVMGDNKKGLAVMRLVARHPNVGADTLELLARSPDDYVLGDVASNEKLSEATLRQLSKRGGYLIEWGLSANQRAPRDVLAALALSDNEFTRANVARNPSASADAGQ